MRGLIGNGTKTCSDLGRFHTCVNVRLLWSELLDEFVNSAASNLDMTEIIPHKESYKLQKKGWELTNVHQHTSGILLPLHRGFRRHYD